MNVNKLLKDKHEADKIIIKLDENICKYKAQINKLLKENNELKCTIDQLTKKYL